MERNRVPKLATPTDVDEYAAQHMWTLITILEDGKGEAYLTPEGAIVKVYYDSKIERVRAIITETHVTGIG